MKRVRVNKIYKFVPCGMDLFHPLWHNKVNPGELVRVINLPNTPKANTMGQCYIADPDTNEFICMVSVHSLQAA